LTTSVIPLAPLRLPPALLDDLRQWAKDNRYGDYIRREIDRKLADMLEDRERQ